MRGRDRWLPLLVTAAVVAFVSYLWLQGRAHAVPYVVTDARAWFTEGDSPGVAASLRADAPPGELLVVDLSWEAVESINGGAYYVLVSAPDGWTEVGCDPGCDWDTPDDVAEFAGALKRRVYEKGARFDADEAARVQVVLRPPDPQGRRPAHFEPAAWLVQTDGENVLDWQRVVFPPVAD